ncbi:MAG: hypothetical protein ACFFAY_14885 [Promethearchaeota archaeon]
MTEIPLPPSADYDEPKKGGCLGGCNKILCVLVIAIVIVGGIVAVILFSGSPVAWDTRTINSWNNSDIETSDAVYYRGAFTVSSSEVETPEVPYVTFEISIDSMGGDTGTVSIHVAVYQTTVAVVDAAATWAELDTYLVGEGDYYDTVDAYADLETYSETYTWVVWFDYTGKTATWDVDLLITLYYAYYE